MSRRKNLRKGIASIAEQIEAHQDKKEEALLSGRVELASYYEKEIANMRIYMEKKRRQMGL
jgi:hypothetical protein